MVGKTHGILGVTGQGSRVSGDLSEKMSATYQGWRVSVDMYILAGQVGCVSGWG